MRPGTFIAAFVAAMTIMSCGRGGHAETEEAISGMPALDSVGLSGLYAGAIGGQVIAAGGSNFPDKPLVEGGKKAYHSTIWMLKDSSFVPVGELPQPSAYGAYAAIGDRLYIAGGSNIDGTLDSFLEISVTGDSVAVDELVPMPAPVEQGVAAVDGDRLLVLGGMDHGVPNLEIYYYDLNEGSWAVAGEIPQAMIQPVAIAKDGVIYIFGGYDPAVGALDYGYVMRDSVWTKINALEGSTFVGSGCVVRGGRLIATGGVNKQIFDNSFTLTGDAQREYQSHPQEWYHFRDCALSFDPQTEKWDTLYVSPHLARAGAAVVATDEGILNLGGELRPGVRCPEVWKLKTEQ